MAMAVGLFLTFPAAAIAAQGATGQSTFPAAASDSASGAALPTPAGLSTMPPAASASGDANSNVPGDLTQPPPADTTTAMPNMITPPLPGTNNRSPRGATNNGIALPAPPTPSALSNNAGDLAAQAEQAALQAQAEAEAAQQHREEEHNRKSFDRAEAGLYPLSDEQIRAFMHKMETTQEAALAPFSGPPKGQVRVINMPLDPGAEPPQINLASNYVTTIDILDSTGAPWPILDVGIGGSFEVSPTQAGSHVVRIMPLSRVGTGNLSVLLKDLPTPVIFRLTADSRKVDLRAEVRIPKFGPNGKVPLVNRPLRLEAGDDQIMAILQNNPPSDAKRVKVTGLDPRTMAWMLGPHVYVRTPLQLLSPAWSASVSSADGTTVYEVGDAPVLLMSDNGAIVRAHLVRDDN